MNLKLKEKNKLGNHTVTMMVADGDVDVVDYAKEGGRIESDPEWELMENSYTNNALGVGSNGQ